MPTYRLPDPEHLAVLDDVLRTIHPRLADAGVTVGLLLAHAKCNKDGEVTGPALKLHGVPCLALVRVSKLRDRIRGIADAVVDVDNDVWDSHTAEQKRSLMSHELEHIVVVENGKTGAPETDDAGRPKLKLRPHDFEIGGFWNTVERFGIDAHESLAYRDLHRKFVQQSFPWG